MLIITRRVGESLMMGEDIEITVLSRRGSQIRLGITAPQTVQVYRKEIYPPIKQQAVPY